MVENNRHVEAMDEAHSEALEEALLQELPGELVRIARVAGLKAAVNIAIEFKGTALYIPSLSDLLRKARDAKIVSAYDEGVSVKALAQRYVLSERRIRHIISATSQAGSSAALIRLLRR